METPLIKAKPCPFCGGEWDYAQCIATKAYYFTCMTPYCGATGPDRKTLDAAKSAWNKRDAS